MPIQHTNRRGKTYWLHEGKTKTGKPKYYFSPKAEGDLVDTTPVGYEIYENPNAQVFLIKELPKVITDEEKAVIEKQLKTLKGSASRYRIDIKGKVITIFQSNQDVDVMQEIIGSLASFRPRRDQDQELQGLLQKTLTYSPIMRFSLEDEDSRTFLAQRYCFRGSVDDYIYIGGPDSLEVLAKKFLPHLGHESFFELY